MNHKRLQTFLCAFFVLANTAFFAAESFDCGSLDNAYGPFDYTNPEDFATKLPVVEAHHFDAGVESLKGHARKGFNMLAGDIDYTLRAFPNHHRALYTMLRFYTELPPEKRRPMHYGPECWFERAIRFSPRDATVYGLYGVYLERVGQSEKAVESFERGLSIQPNSAELNYNLGLLLLKLGQTEKALHYATIAYRSGFPLPGLKRKLHERGVEIPE